MNIDYFDIFIKHLSLYISLSFCFIKIIDYTQIKNSKKIILLLLPIFLAILQCLLQNILPKYVRMLIIFTIFSIILGKTVNLKLSNSIIISILSLAISYIMSTLCYIVVFSIPLLFHIENTFLINKICIVCISILTVTLTILLFNIKKLKHGFPFVKNKLGSNFWNIIIITVSTIIIFMYFFLGFFETISAEYLTYALIIFVILSIVIIQKTFVYYHKQKLQTKALKDYEQEISETKQKLETAIAEKEQIIKSNHEFYHRQEALNKKLDNLINLKANSMNTEFGNEYSDILDRLNTLSSEYKTKTTVIPVLDKTNITEIDDMLIYMQSECAKDNIEFTVKIECDITYMINNFITKSQLETLLGDLIRNAIIAVNHSPNSFKSIMVILGIKDDSYELCIYDSGIPFEIDTLVNLGVQPASTHLDEGGTGIGFITTFETINSCKASFIINEITNNNYTKSLEVKFDNQNEYEIISNRAEEIRKANVLNRNIVLK